MHLTIISKKKKKNNTKPVLFANMSNFPNNNLTLINVIISDSINLDDNEPWSMHTCQSLK